MKEGNVLVIVIGGVIAQLLDQNDNNEIELIPAKANEIHKNLIEKDGSSSIELIESKYATAKPVRVKIANLFDDESNIEQRDSAQVNPIIWSQLVGLIKKNINDFEGMVVLHGLDTLAYTASAVSFMTRNLNIPIVFTGSQRPLNYVRSDARQNIYTAITIAASKFLGLKPINEVTIYLHDTLYRANRATMSSATSYRSFDSLNYPAMATVGEHIDIKEHLILESKTTNVVFSTKSDANVQIIDVFPGMLPNEIASIVENDLDHIYLENLKRIAMKIAYDSGEVFEQTEEAGLLSELEKTLQKHTQSERLVKFLPKNMQADGLEVIKRLDKKILKNTVKGVILRTYGMGTAPTSPGVLKALRNLAEAGIIVMNVTQAHSHRVSFNSDPVSLRLFEQGVISGLDMTAESAFAKMVVVLSDEKNIEKGQDHCEDELQNNIAGEQSHSVVNYHFDSGCTEEFSSFYSAKLQFTNKEKDFGLSSEYLKKIDNIQLRILGLHKNVRGGLKVMIKIVRADDEMEDIENGLEVLNVEQALDNPIDEETKTINVSYDITNLKEPLFAKNIVFNLVSDQEIAWSRISIVVFSTDE